MIQNSHDIAQFRSKYKLNSKFQDFWYKFFIKIYKLIYYNCQNELNTKWYILSFCYTLFKQKLSTHFYLKKKKKVASIYFNEKQNHSFKQRRK